MAGRGTRGLGESFVLRFASQSSRSRAPVASLGDTIHRLALECPVVYPESLLQIRREASIPYSVLQYGLTTPVGALGRYQTPVKLRPADYQLRKLGIETLFFPSFSFPFVLKKKCDLTKSHLRSDQGFVPDTARWAQGSVACLRLIGRLPIFPRIYGADTLAYSSYQEGEGLLETFKPDWPILGE
ncbi:hypothetical protein VTK26DRAFT_7492 [Humicola hyalothermophila]